MFIRLDQYKTRGRILLPILLLILWPAAVHPAAQRLEAGKPVLREMTGGETHKYVVSLEPNQYLQIAADQKGIDIVIKLIDPAGKVQVEMDSPNNTQGPEIASLIAGQQGNYLIEIDSLIKTAPKAQYELLIDSIRTATEQDRKWIEGQTTYLEGQRLQSEEKADSRRRAILQFQTAALIWRTLGDQVMEAHALSYVAAVCRDLGQLKRALESYDEALKLQLTGPARREATYTLLSMGRVYYEMGEPQKALELYRRALLEQREMHDFYAEAETLGDMGLAFFSMGEVRLALEHFNNSLAFWSRNKIRFREAETLNNIGNGYRALGDSQQAMEKFISSLAIYRSLKAREGEAEELNNIGHVNSLLGEWQKALDYYKQALTLWRASGDRRREAIVLSNIGLAYASLKDAKKAFENYEESLKYHREVGNQLFEAATLEYIGDLLASSGEFTKALNSYDSSLTIRRTLGIRLGEASTLAGIGFLYKELNEPGKSLENLNQSLDLSRALGDRRGEARALYGIAGIERDFGNLDQAQKVIDQALSAAESVRSAAGSQQLRATFLASVRKYFELSIDILMQMHRAKPDAGYAEMGLQAAERARARGLIEMLAESRTEIRQGVDEALLERERKLAELINVKAQRKLQLLAQNASEAQLILLNSEIGSLEDEYQQAQIMIRKSSPRYAAITQPEPLTFREIQERVLDKDSMLLEYSLGEERSYLWAATSEGVTGFELAKRDDIQKAATIVYQLLTARTSFKRGETLQQQRDRISRADSDLPEAAARLSRLVLAPVAHLLGSKKLIIVPDGALQYIPFAMLPEPEGGMREEESLTQQSTIRIQHSSAPLIVGHEVISLPSASTLAILRKEIGGRTPAPKMLAIFADPVFSADDTRIKAVDRKAVSIRGAKTRSIVHEEDKSSVKIGNFSIPRLPFTRLEADRILATSTATDNLKLLDYNASRKMAISAEMSNYKYLHFATHGLLDNEHPGLSALVLSLVDEKGKAQDGFLRAHEIYNLKLPAELVVLSACQTGLGSDISGEGLIGLTRGFMYAGAARVIVSLWSVNDKATSELMTRFYQKMLKENQRPATALRSTQIEMWRQKNWNAPYYWAAFVLQGESN
jgi:CHAT domain-containing protein/tetratricopeptide (TPR) repeat protein